MTDNVQSFLRSGKQGGQEMDATTVVVATPAMAMVKGIDGPDWVVACVLLDIEVVGARLVRQRFPDAVLIFVVPPSGAVLAERLRARGTESEQVVAGRLEKAREELAAAVEYDYVVVNDALDEAVHAVHAILDAEARRTSRQRDVAILLDRLRAEVAAELARSTAHR